MVEAKEGRLITWVAAGVAKVTPSVTAALWPPVGKGVSKQSGVSELPSCSSARMAVEDFTLRLGGVLAQGRVCPGRACGMVVHKDVYTNKLRGPGLEVDRRLQTIRWQWDGATALLNWTGGKRSQTGMRRRRRHLVCSLCGSVKHLPPTHWQLTADF